MNNISAVLDNKLFIPALVSWAIAQLIKVLLTLVFMKKLDFHRLFGSGGMPSSHTSFVMALTTSAGLEYGWDSPFFAVAAALAAIVMYDAAGVRRAAGKQAATLNRIIATLAESGHANERHEALRELLGHSPLEVIMGAILGIFLGILFYYT